MLGLSRNRQFAGCAGRVDSDAVREQERESRDVHADLHRDTCRRQPHTQYDRSTHGEVKL